MSETPGPAHQLLNPFVGKWNTDGYIKESGNSPAIEIKGTDIYQWLPGGFFLLHKVDVKMGSERHQSVEIIGYDASSNSYPMHFYDNKGNSGVMHAKVNNGVWTFYSTTMRFTGSFNENGKVLSGRWELSENGTNWSPWMEIRLSKAV